MRWMLALTLWGSLGAGGGNLQERLTHRVDHGWIVTVLEIDRDVVLPSEKHLLAVLTIEPSGPKPVSLAFQGAEAVALRVECADRKAAWSSSRRLAPGERNRAAPPSGWPIHLRIPLRNGQAGLPPGQCILHTRLLVNPPLENRIAFQVR